MLAVGQRKTAGAVGLTGMLVVQSEKMGIHFLLWKYRFARQRKSVDQRSVPYKIFPHYFFLESSEEKKIVQCTTRSTPWFYYQNSPYHLG